MHSCHALRSPTSHASPRRHVSWYIASQSWQYRFSRAASVSPQMPHCITLMASMTRPSCSISLRVPISPSSSSSCSSCSSSSPSSPPVVLASACSRACLIINPISKSTETACWPSPTLRWLDSVLQMGHFKSMLYLCHSLIQFRWNSCLQTSKHPNWSPSWSPSKQIGHSFILLYRTCILLAPPPGFPKGFFFFFVLSIVLMKLLPLTLVLTFLT